MDNIENLGCMKTKKNKMAPEACFGILGNEGDIQEVYLITKNDFVWENGEIVKAKRKYGKHTRSVIKLTPDTPTAENIEVTKHIGVVGRTLIVTGSIKTKEQ
jgi:hypothetical protein